MSLKLSFVTNRFYNWTKLKFLKYSVNGMNRVLYSSYQRKIA